MKIIVTGDREWTSYDSIVDAYESVCIEFDVDPSDIILIVGGARGADDIADRVGDLLGMGVRTYYAHWHHTEECPRDCREMQGRPAGAIRNSKMLKENPDIDLALAFHSNLKESKG
ncbi:hypothetical protein LCGC14_1727880, partial [marine sediment metagenome]